MLNEESAEGAALLPHGRDEISEMAHAFVHFAQEINRRAKELGVVSAANQGIEIMCVGCGALRHHDRPLALQFRLWQHEVWGCR